MRLFGSITNFAITLSVVVLVCGGCADDPDAQNAGAGSGESHEHGGERHEHDGDGEGHHDKEGEESGTQYTLDQQYDETRHGARLVLAYDKQGFELVCRYRREHD